MANDEKNFGTGTIIISFLAGAAIGTGLALLFAPRSGRETRARIKEAAGDAVETIREYAEEAQGRLKEVYEEGRESLAEKKSIFQSAVQAGRDAIEQEKQKRS